MRSLAATTLVWVAHVATLLSGAPEVATTATQLAVFPLSVLTCILGARAASRRAGIALAFALAAYAEAAAYYVVVDDAANRFPSFLDIGLPLFYLLAALAVVEFVRLWQANFKASTWLDATVGASALIALGTVVVERGSLDSSAAVGQLVYFLADLTTLGLLVAVWFLRGARLNPGLFLLAAAALMLAVADGAFVYRVEVGQTDPTALQLALWSGAMVLFAAASGQRPRPPHLRDNSWADVVVPVGSALVALPIALGSDDVARAAAFVALALVIGRLALGLADNKRLLHARTLAAVTDPLTGLANRHALLEALDRGLERARAGDGFVGVLFIDIDDFKTVNDTRGHAAGDKLLVSVGRALRAVVRRTVAPDQHRTRPIDTVGRLGGDEFVVVLDGLRDTDELALVAERLLEQLAGKVDLDERATSLSASIGMTTADAWDARSASELLADTDIAMYAAKQTGRGRAQVFTRAMREEVLSTASLVADLRQALQRDEFVLLYQPQVALESGEIVGVEALVRWQHPRLGLLTPDRFIGLAERHGLITAVDDWVLEAACGQLAAWRRRGVTGLAVSVNVSGHRLMGSDLAAMIESTLARTGVSHADLEIEVTETVAVENSRLAVEALERVRASGVSVAIDDFGVGHSALSRLLTFPVDRLKIDRAFVEPLTPATAADSLVAAMVAMARSLQLGIVAEGIETEEHLSALRSLGCGRGQGFLFARPLPAAELERLMIERRLALPPGRRGTAELAQPMTPPIHAILSELERLTGFESTYVTTVSEGRQRVLEVRNAGALEIPGDLDVAWDETLCRRMVEEQLVHTDSVAERFGDVSAARDLGLQSFASVPLLDEQGAVVGTLCGASHARIALSDDADEVMKGFARLIAQRLAGRVQDEASPQRPS